MSSTVSPTFTLSDALVIAIDMMAGPLSDCAEDEVDDDEEEDDDDVVDVPVDDDSVELEALDVSEVGDGGVVNEKI